MLLCIKKTHPPSSDQSHTVSYKVRRREFWLETMHMAGVTGDNRQSYGTQFFVTQQHKQYVRVETNL